MCLPQCITHTYTHTGTTHHHTPPPPPPHKYKCLQPETHTKASTNTHNDQAPHLYMKSDDSCGYRRAAINGDLATSALAEYASSTSHPINWSEARVIATCSHTSRRCLLESWMIHIDTNHLNRELGSLPHIYKTIIRHS